MHEETVAEQSLVVYWLPGGGQVISVLKDQQMPAIKQPPWLASMRTYRQLARKPSISVSVCSPSRRAATRCHAWWPLTRRVGLTISEVEDRVCKSMTSSEDDHVEERVAKADDLRVCKP